MSHLLCTLAGVLRRLAPPTTAVALALMAGACTGPRHDPAQLVSPSAPTPAITPSAHKSSDAGAIPSRASPDDPGALLTEARNLRRAGDKKGAYALLETAGELHPEDRALLQEQGLLAIELGHIAKAQALLTKAIERSGPDWRLHSALGAALAASGQQQAAQGHFAKALGLAPDHPAVLNNLALSYALDGRQEEAERLLRRIVGREPSAPATAQAKQNLALILGLSGRMEEARRVSEATLPAAQAKANLAYLQKPPATAKMSSSAAAPPVKSAQAADAGVPATTYQLGGPRE